MKDFKQPISYVLILITIFLLTNCAVFRKQGDLNEGEYLRLAQAQTNKKIFLQADYKFSDDVAQERRQELQSAWAKIIDEELKLIHRTRVDSKEAADEVWNLKLARERENGFGHVILTALTLGLVPKWGTYLDSGDLVVTKKDNSSKRGHYEEESTTVVHLFMAPVMFFYPPRDEEGPQRTLVRKLIGMGITPAAH